MKKSFGERTIGKLLRIAIEPMGQTMYVWGGGWNEADDAAGEEARSIGVSARWAEFAKQQDKNYDYEKTRYQIHDGLDCSGYVGWVIYNVFEQFPGNTGYVMSAEKMACEYAKCGWGEYTPAKEVKDWKAGDIMSMKGHVWIVAGMCPDGSVVLMHSSPPGVILCGTTDRGKSSQAKLLAEKYMKTYFPHWYAKYPKCERSSTYLTDSARMRWNAQTMSDAKLWDGKSAEEVLEWLFSR